MKRNLLFFVLALLSITAIASSVKQDDPDPINLEVGLIDPTVDHGGHLELLGQQTVHASSQQVFADRRFLYTNLCVCSSSSVTIQSIFTQYGNTKIIVEPNGTLVIDGGQLLNADIELNSGSKLIVRNGGTITMRNGKDFYAPLGAIVEIEEGMIE